MPATTAHPSTRTLEVDGARVDKAIQKIQDAFDAGGGSHLDPRDTRDMALLTFIERWQIAAGEDPVWDAVAALLDPTGSLRNKQTIAGLGVLVSSVDRLLGENDVDVPWQMVRDVEVAYEAVGDAIEAWKALVP